MSSLEDRKSARLDAEVLDARYKDGVEKIRKSQAIEKGQAAALMFAALAYQDVLETNTLFAKASHAAKLFCIAAAMIIPNLLFIRVVF